MVEKNKTLDTLAMDGKLMARADSCEIKASHVKEATSSSTDGEGFF
jgi:hypothetical protein